MVVWICLVFTLLMPSVAQALACSSVFPSAAQNHDPEGKIEMEKNSQIRGDADAVLQTTELKNEAGSRSCHTAPCVASGSPSAAFDPPTFQYTNSSYTVDTSGTFVLGGDGRNAYKEIKLAKNSTLLDQGAYTEYFITKLEVEKNTVIELRAGTDYWIEEFVLKSGSVINVVGDGTVRLFTAKDFVLDKNVRVNSPSSGRAGSAEQLLIYSFGKVVLEKNVTLSALVYADTEVEIKQNADLFGSASAGKLIKLEKNTSITYQENAPNAADLGELCDGDDTTLDHLRILHDGQALTCAPEPVTILACKNTACDERILDAVTVALAPSGWLGGDSLTITGGEASAELRQTSVGSVTLDATSPTAGNPTRCFIGATESCILNFADSGLIYDVPDLTACETSTDIIIRAVKKSDAGVSCAPAFSGTRSISFWSDYSDPATGTRNLWINGVLVPDSMPGTGIDLSFDANAQATFTASYRDAGRLQLNARYTGTGAETGLQLEGSDQFVSRPHSLYSMATTDGSSLLNNAVSTGEPKWAAGNDFRLQLRGQCADGTLLPNYQPANAEVWLEMAAPLSGSAGVLSLLGSDYASSYTANWINLSSLFTDGVIIESTQSATDPNSYALAAFSEVGVFTLHFRDGNYLGGAVSPAADLTIGRFHPADFLVSINDHGTLTPACGNFTYTGQVMGYAVNPKLNITARNADGATTRNYTGGFMQLLTANGSAVNFSVPAADGSQSGHDGTNPTTLTVSLNSNLDNIIDNGNGTLIYPLSVLDQYLYPRDANSRVLPYTSDIDLPLATIIDGDGVTDAGSPILLQPAGVEIRYGRLLVDDSYGPQTDDLNLSVRAEYYNGTDFVDNPDDYCSIVAPTLAVTLDNWQDNLSTGETSVTGTTGLLAGRGEFILNAPGVGSGSDTNDGAVDLTLDLSSTAPPQTWLLNDENADGLFNENPSCTASFGMYRGDDRFLYWRETQ